MTIATYCIAVIACGLGSALRFWLGTKRRPHHWPWPTLVVNVAGTAVLGFSSHVLARGNITPGLAMIVGAGLAGGLTTFSTLATEVMLQWREQRRTAVVYGAATVVLGSVAGWLGWAMATIL